jgi:hypothetical protein
VTNPDFAQGASTNEREGSAASWGAPSDSAPPVDQMNSRREYAGFGQLPQDTRRQPVMGDEVKRMASNLCTPQAAHSLIWEPRGGTSRQCPLPDGTGYHGSTQMPSPSGRIKSVIRHDDANGLGPAYARQGPQEDTRAGNPPADYLRSQSPLDKYVGAKDILREGDWGSGFPAGQEQSQVPTMGEDILSGFAERAAQRAASHAQPPSSEVQRAQAAGADTIYSKDS